MDNEELIYTFEEIKGVILKGLHCVFPLLLFAH